MHLSFYQRQEICRRSTSSAVVFEAIFRSCRIACSDVHVNSSNKMTPVYQLPSISSSFLFSSLYFCWHSPWKEDVHDHFNDVWCRFFFFFKYIYWLLLFNRMRSILSADDLELPPSPAHVVGSRLQFDQSCPWSPPVCQHATSQINSRHNRLICFFSNQRHVLSVHAGDFLIILFHLKNNERWVC